jgi:hypothetical protein
LGLLYFPTTLRDLARQAFPRPPKTTPVGTAQSGFRQSGGSV